jgi:hypothetical protein
MMKSKMIGGALALATLAGTPLAAQPAPGGWQSNRGAGGWDRETFWRGAPEGPRERIDFLQRRIDRGIADGSLDRREGRRAQAELGNIRRDVMRMRGRMTPQSRDMVQRRLDDLSQRIRWARRDGSSYGGGFNGPSAGPGRDDDRRFVTDYDASRHYRDAS